MRRVFRQRKVTGAEEEIIIAAIDGSFGAGVTHHVLKPGTLVLIEKRHKVVYRLSKALYQVFKHLEQAQEGREGPLFHSFGLPVGLFVGKQFLIGVEVIRELAKHTKNRVEVTVRGEQMFLYGRNLQKRNLKDVPGDLGLGARVIVQNGRKEALGLGELLEAGNSFEILPHRREVIKNLKDLGTRYLREEN